MQARTGATVWSSTARRSCFRRLGQAGDAPGRVVLVDNRGEELNSMDVDMVQMATQPQWSQDRVTIRLLLDWKLE